MGTRGAFGFRIDGKDFVSYNQFDSYPGGKGQDVVDWLQGLTPAQRAALPERVRALKLVTDSMVPTPEDIAQLHPRFSNLGVSNQSTDDWYCLTHKTHGDLGAILDSGYMMDALDFLKDSLFCEYAYIVNLDESVLEVYKGFNRLPGRPGRYTKPVEDLLTAKVINKLENTDEYYPVALWGTFPLDKLPKELESALPADEDDDEVEFEPGEKNPGGRDDADYVAEEPAVKVLAPKGRVAKRRQTKRKAAKRKATTKKPAKTTKPRKRG